MRQYNGKFPSKKGYLSWIKSTQNTVNGMLKNSINPVELGNEAPRALLPEPKKILFLYDTGLALHMRYGVNNKAINTKSPPPGIMGANNWAIPREIAVLSQKTTFQKLSLLRRAFIKPVSGFCCFLVLSHIPLYSLCIGDFLVPRFLVKFCIKFICRFWFKAYKLIVPELEDVFKKKIQEFNAIFKSL